MNIYALAEDALLYQHNIQIFEYQKIQQHGVMNATKASQCFVIMNAESLFEMFARKTSVVKYKKRVTFCERTHSTSTETRMKLILIAFVLTLVLAAGKIFVFQG